MYSTHIKIANKLEVFRICNDISKYIRMYFCILKVIWKTNIVEFGIKYFHLICHLILPVFQYNNANDMRMTQDLNSFGEIIAHAQCSVDANIYIYNPCVPHKNNCKKQLVHATWNSTDSSIIIVRNVCVLTSASMIVYLFFTRSWSAIIGPKLFFTSYDRQSSVQSNRKLISLHNNSEDDKHAHGFADF